MYKHYTHTNNMKQITLSVDARGMTVREKPEMKIKILY